MIIPSINSPTFEGAAQYIRQAQSFLPKDGWIHIDVSDGEFSNTTSWGDPAQFANLEVPLQTEVHLMVADPDALVLPWLEAGVKRIIVHVQTVRDLKEISNQVKKYGAQLMLSFDPSQPIEKVKEYVEEFDQFQILAASPGPSGQEFNPETLKKISLLRQLSGGAKIEVDIGMNPTTGKQALEAGADILVSGNYIFNHPNPKKAFEELNSI